MEIKRFRNYGFGWSCVHCENASDQPSEVSRHSRLLREGEAESKQPQLSSPYLARWADSSRRTLECPRCGAREHLPAS
jgi:hypothetical protein